jgi:nucleotide-binding universal stress UspA family protein
VVESELTDNDFSLERAVQLADKYHGKVTVFKSYYKRLDHVNESTGIPDDLALFITEQQRIICEKVNKLTQNDLSLNIVISWKEPPEISIGHLIMQQDISLIIKSPCKKRLFIDYFSSTIDRFLIRDCDLPVWLVKSGYFSTELNILACLDVEDESENNQHLNHNILEASEQILPLLQSELHLIDCYCGESVAMDINYDHDSGFKVEVSEQQKHSQKMTHYINQHALNNDHVHINIGLPDHEILRTVNQIEARLTIIGNNKGDGILSRTFGDTTQLLTDNLPCDVLVIKEQQMSA